jgi:acyl carrier protein
MHSMTDSIIEILVGRLEIRAERPLTPETTFASLDIDSLVLVELAVIIEGQFGTRVPEGALTARQTIAEAAAVLDGLTSPQHGAPEVLAT